MAAAEQRTGARAWVVLGILAFVYVLNFLDRQLLSILAKPIQDSLHLSDSQLGKIGGLYFALFYCLIAIPVGWLADRTNRVRLLAVACGLWSAATMACGLSASYPQLVASRMAVGVGEAGGVPPSYAIISDYFPPGRRGTALSIFNLGPPVGQALGVAIGASIAAAYGWRPAFIVLGAAGILAALIVVSVVREPKRGGLDAPAKADVGAAKAGFWPTVKAFFSNPALVLVALGGGVTQIITYGAGNFSTLFLMREKGMTLQEVALYYAILVAICMGGGIFVSGRVLDRYATRWKPAYALIPAVSLLAAAPFFFGFIFAPTWPVALAFLAGPTTLNYFYLSASVTLTQEEVRPDRRVLSGALLLLIMNLTGMGVGPTFVGAVSDALRPEHPTNSLQLAFLSLTPFYALAILIFLALTWVLKREADAQAARP
ncbi:spinster family MFS transporter [Phenylobacterium soli]|uniref:MFS transporter n=1 Tax=Phenylobacterium soli TaxID=2170551 RepID=A0A328ALP1_9CAUL|nr:MFS transporter [Phenylobacterium soli]RAK55873.1 MFS transporter [Phenylobacterium soli]